MHTQYEGNTVRTQHTHAFFNAPHTFGFHYCQYASHVQLPASNLSQMVTLQQAVQPATTEAHGTVLQECEQRRKQCCAAWCLHT